MNYNSWWNFSNLSSCTLECDSLLAVCYTDHAINGRYIYHRKCVMRIYHLQIVGVQIKSLMQDRTVDWHELGLHVAKDTVFQKKVCDILKRTLVSAFFDRVWHCSLRQRNSFLNYDIVVHACKKISKKNLDPLFPLFSMLHLCRTCLYNWYDMITLY